MSELMFTSCDPVRLFRRHEVILKAGKAQIYHAPKANAGEPMEHMKPLTRAMIGYAYATGGWLAAPYDLFIGAGIPRYFGKPADYADLYGFIRANARYLDGFRTRCLRRRRGSAMKPRGTCLRIEGGSGGVYAFARTKPDEPEAPIVIHLVDWGEELEFVEGRFRDRAGFNSMSYKRGDKAPFTLKVRMANCYGDRSFTARLLTPPAVRPGHALAGGANRRLLGTLRKPVHRVSKARRVCRVPDSETQSLRLAGAGSRRRTVKIQWRYGNKPVARLAVDLPCAATAMMDSSLNR